MPNDTTSATSARHNPAGVGLFELLGHASPETVERRRLRRAQLHQLNLRAQVLQQTRTANPDWTADDWDTFYRENGDALGVPSLSEPDAP